MKVRQFEDLIAWQKAQDLAVLVYQTFSNQKDYGFKDQICRASVSVSNNIAEGFDRRTTVEFSRFLFIASASCSEVRSMFYLAIRLKYIKQSEFEELSNSANEVSKIIFGLIRSIREK